MIPSRAEAGFALVEAVAALGVIAVVSAMFLAAVQSSAMTRRHVAELRAASLVARSRLDQAVEQARLDGSGRDGAFAWTARVVPYPGTANGRGLEEVTVAVRNRESGTPILTLKTLRLAR